MILTCPSCSANYMVSNEALGDQGRDVRCVKCGHVWFQKSERQHLDELIEKIQGESPDDISFEVGQKAPAPTAAKVEKVISSKAALPKRNKAKDTSKNKRVMAFPNILGFLKKGAVSTKLAGFMVGAALFSLILLVLVMFQKNITDISPSLKSVYALLDRSVSPEDIQPLDKVIGLDHLNFVPAKDNGTPPSFTGMMINLTKQTVTIPLLVVTIMDEEHKFLGEMTLAVPRDSLAQEETYDLDIKFPRPLPTNASIMDIHFSWPEQGKEKSSEHHGAVGG